MSVQVGDKLPLTTTFQELVDGKPSVSDAPNDLASSVL